MTTRKWASLLTILVVVCVSLALAQTAKHALGATATVQNLDLTNNTATLVVTNTSDKDITAYSVAVDIIHTSGKKDHSETMQDYGPLLTSKGEILHPGHTSEHPELWKRTDDDPVVGMEAKVVTVVYNDHSAEVIDEQAFQRINEHRTSVMRALQKSAEIIGNALADPANQHPSAKAASQLTALMENAKATHSMDIDVVYLQIVRDELQNAPARSAERGISERAYVTEQYAGYKQTLPNMRSLRR